MTFDMANRTRPDLLDPDAPGARLAFVLDAEHGPTRGEVHRHRRAQLVHAARGVLVVTTPEGRWVVPPERAVWIPSRTPHAVASRRSFHLRTLYVEPRAAPLVDPGRARVVAVDRLVAELLAVAAGFGPRYPRGGAEERLVRVILDRLPALAVAPLHVPSPKTPALVAIARALEDDPADRRTLAELGRAVGATERTLARWFAADLGTTFRAFRAQVRLLAALERLGAGHDVTRTAFEVGYADVSSFIEAFKAATGTTPARYFGAASIRASAASAVGGERPSSTA